MKLKIGTKVKTIHGLGFIIGYDLPDSNIAWRYKIKLENNPFNFIPCYFKSEIEVYYE
jgi:hypothetical protein